MARHSIITKEKKRRQECNRKYYDKTHPKKKDMYTEEQRREYNRRYYKTNQEAIDKKKNRSRWAEYGLHSSEGEGYVAPRKQKQEINFKTFLGLLPEQISKLDLSRYDHQHCRFQGHLRTVV